MLCNVPEKHRWGIMREKDDTFCSSYLVNHFCFAVATNTSAHYQLEVCSVVQQLVHTKYSMHHKHYTKSSSVCSCSISLFRNQKVFSFIVGANRVFISIVLSFFGAIIKKLHSCFYLDSEKVEVQVPYHITVFDRVTKRVIYIP